MSKDHRSTIALEYEIMHDVETLHTAQKMARAAKYFFSIHEQIRRKLWICWHLLKKFFTENFAFYAVSLEDISLKSTDKQYFFTRFGN